MKAQVHILIAALLLAMASVPLHGQGNAKQFQKQQNRLAQQERKAEQRSEEERERREDLRMRIQPHVDRIGRQLARMEHRDQLVGAYLNSLGQSMVPAEVDAAASFSFRVIYDFRPNAMALPDGRIFVTSGLLASVENEAQLATVLGHEIAHVIEEHTLDHLRRRQGTERRNRIIGSAAGAALGGLLGGKKGGAATAVAAGAAGAAAGFGIASVINAVTRAKFSREQEKEADLIGCELAMARGFDPEQGQVFFERLNSRYGKRRFGLSKALLNNLGAHPTYKVRASNINSLLVGDLASQYQGRRDRGELATGSGRFGRMLSGLIRDNGILLAEHSDRFDLALENLERARRYRPNDPLLLWGLGRVSLLLGRTDEQLQKAADLLAMAIDADQRKLYPAIHRDLAYFRAVSGGDYNAAAEGLKQYVLGHMAAHGTLPSDLEEVYDKLVLFGDGSWTPPGVERQDGIEVSPVSVAYTPTVWATPGGGLRSLHKESPEPDPEMQALSAIQTSLSMVSGVSEVAQAVQ